MAKKDQSTGYSSTELQKVVEASRANITVTDSLSSDEDEGAEARPSASAAATQETTKAKRSRGNRRKSKKAASKQQLDGVDTSMSAGTMGNVHPVVNGNSSRARATGNSVNGHNDNDVDEEEVDQLASEAPEDTQATVASNSNAPAELQADATRSAGRDTETPTPMQEQQQPAAVQPVKRKVGRPSKADKAERDRLAALEKKANDSVKASVPATSKNKKKRKSDKRAKSATPDISVPNPVLGIGLHEEENTDVVPKSQEEDDEDAPLFNAPSSASGSERAASPPPPSNPRPITQKRKRAAKEDKEAAPAAESEAEVEAEAEAESGPEMEEDVEEQIEEEVEQPVKKSRKTKGPAKDKSKSKAKDKGKGKARAVTPPAAEQVVGEEEEDAIETASDVSDEEEVQKSLVQELPPRPSAKKKQKLNKGKGKEVIPAETASPSMDAGVRKSARRATITNGASSSGTSAQAAASASAASSSRRKSTNSAIASATPVASGSGTSSQAAPVAGGSGTSSQPAAATATAAAAPATTTAVHRKWKLRLRNLTAMQHKNFLAHRTRSPDRARGRPWSEEEELTLILALNDMYDGAGVLGDMTQEDITKVNHKRWVTIRGQHGLGGSLSTVLSLRTNVDLKDKARNIQKYREQLGLPVFSWYTYPKLEAAADEEAAED